MSLIVSAVIVLLGGACLSLMTRRAPRLASIVGSGTAIVGSLLALAVAAKVLWTGQPLAMSLAWQVPLGSCRLAVDPLSAVFVLPIALIVAVAAIYGAQYMPGSYRPPAIGPAWFFFNGLAATMLLVVTARNGLLFLLCWEGMSLSSFFLVLTDHEREPVRRASWIYLAAMHLGTACLLVLFLLLGRSSGSLDFDRFACEPGLQGLLFVLAVVGFGTKAGFLPVHVWLPEAHPAAPSHVSAVMSGVMIKTGIYGLLRTLTFLPDAPSWWGWTLVTIGAFSGILGVLFALAQHDLKRLLAYSSVENIGIISLGTGVGLLGVAYRIPAMAMLGFAGAMLHVLNHAVFKSLLFLGAGAIQHGAGTRNIDRLGGLLKKMPVTGATFLTGAAAISGLPPLNGFVSELLIYLGVLTALADHGRVAGVEQALLCVLVVGSLALVGGLAAACFIKAFGCVFLGEPRGDHAKHGHEAGAAMRASMLVLAGACFAISLTGPLWPWLYRSAIVAVAPAEFRDAAQAGLEQASVPLAVVCVASWVLLGLVGLLAMVRRRLLSGRTVDRGPTWDCGYAAPTPRMQYTSSSFASPLLFLFRMFLRPRVHLRPPEGPFPKQASFESETPDVFRVYLFQPVFMATAWIASRLRWFQYGRIQVYVLYIALTILILLVWKLG
jgi:formate hydrogenlyase subunit 3/multisubunit Na+/H+ antiporter MnhD subunit